MGEGTYGWLAFESSRLRLLLDCAEPKQPELLCSPERLAMDLKDSFDLYGTKIRRKGLSQVSMNAM